MGLLAAIAAALAFACTAVPSAQARVPDKFVGTVADGALMTSTPRFDSELDTMVGSGVGSVRLVFDWRTAQPYADWADVPAEERARFRDEGGVPTYWGEIDAHVAGTAQRRLRLLPIIIQAPDWAARHPGRLSSPPSDFAAYARFAGLLVRRYGPDGTFWAENPDLPRRPLREWQIWNEPNFVEFWSDQPFHKDYVKMLRRASRAIRDADPRARVVLAGFAHKSWVYLRRVYRRKGARRLFDVVALHPFTAKPDGTLEILRRGRRVMRKHGDRRKPLKVTELSWTSARGKTSDSFGWDQNERGQATLLRRAYRLLVKHRRSLRLENVYWYTWLTRDASNRYPFDYAGLSRLDGDEIERKPAFRTFRRVALDLVGCERKSARADRCAE